MAESRLAVFLLLACHVAVEHLLHHHYFLLLGCNEHKHTSGEVAAAERVLAKKRQRFEVWHIRVKHDERYVQFVQLVGELAGDIER